MKKTRLKKKSKQSISLIQRKIWEHVKRIVRKNHTNTCYTCHSSGLTGANFQTGHMWAKASVGAFLKYDLRILRPQCFKCNIHHGGSGALFYARMLKEIGPEEMAKLEADRQVTVKAMDHYIKILDEYSKL
jgi:hypothetical protein